MPDANDAAKRQPLRGDVEVANGEARAVTYPLRGDAIFAVAFAATALLHISAAAADDSAGTTTPATPAATPDQANTAAAETAEDSLASPPPIALFHGGSLGIPAPVGTRSVQASSTLKVDNPTDGSAVDFDFMAKVGGVNLYDKVQVDIVGEQYQQLLPVITLGGPAALPVMTTTSPPVAPSA